MQLHMRSRSSIVAPPRMKSKSIDEIAPEEPPTASTKAASEMLPKRSGSVDLEADESAPLIDALPNYCLGS